MSNEVVQFVDETAGFTQGITSSPDETFAVSDTNNTSLGDFLKRPVRIGTVEWEVATNVATSFKVWELFQKNPAVLDKIQNYELIRHQLHLKILISGSPFHYGRVIAAYNPWDRDDQVTMNRGYFPSDVINLSQKPHVWLDPGSNVGGQLDCPFFYDSNYMSITNNSAEDMGSLILHSTQPLKHANAGNDTVTISIYAWASDVVLSGPTSQLISETARYQSQAGFSEYGKGIISKPASAVASAAGALRRIPQLAPYARATEIISSSVGNAAYLLGFSRPAIISDELLIKPFPQGNFANTDAAEAVSKMTLDSKQELTVDSRTVGLSGKDEMILDDLLARESFLCSFNMLDSDVVDDVLFSARVTPQLWDEVFGEYHMTPACFFAGMFKYWHGTMKFRFQIVKTQYHKGRIAVRFDPNELSPVVNFNETYTRIVDIAEEDEFEIEIGWSQNTPFRQCKRVANAAKNWATGSYITPDRSYSNGMLGVTVVNKLVGPADQADISFNVLVSFHDAKLGMPLPDNMNKQSWFEPEVAPSGRAEYKSQSAVIAEGSSDTGVPAPEGAPAMEPVMAPKDSDHYHEVFFGESPHSLRELIKRYTKLRSFVSPSASPGTVALVKEQLRIFPYFRGFDPSGINQTSFAASVNYTQNTMLNMIGPCFAGFRGGIRHKFVYNGEQSGLANPMVTASSASITDPYDLTTTFLTGTPAELTIAASLNAGKSSWFGRATTNLGINDTIEVEMPFYTPKRMQNARAVANDRALSRIMNHEFSVGESEDKYASYDQYVCAAEDFSYFFFTGVPRQFYYDLTGAE